MKKVFNWLMMAALLAGILAGCAAPAPEVIEKEVEVTRVVEKEVEVPAEAGPVTLEVLNPRGELPPQPVLAISPRVDDLAGKTIGLVDNTKPGAKYFFDRLEQELTALYPTATINRYRKTDYRDVQTDLYEEVASQCDAFVFAIGD
jgi:hypothetical protein